ncbi:bifunctional diguanylate cyclase/phosphodiesterase [Afifella sp. IM 167]|uniref:putative bifunctional diguanylate cyclase/phosphodiesterase n=1 Tax=Afifella sp. IM 167 TaxID=2033586 RepID=UPI001CCD1D08|nr:EAL domain-containing protein [Afifella sp. IM 167]
MRIIRSLAMIAFAALVAYAISFNTNLFEALYHYSRAHESWQLDEVFGGLSLFAVVLLLLSIFRVFELRRRIVQKERAEREAGRLARHDALTGLPNRRQLFEVFAHRNAVPDGDAPCAVFLIDLDRFKPVNDMYGHQVGDEALCILAERMKALLDGHGFVARLGGDEFAAIVDLAPDSPELLRLVRQLAEALSQPIQIDQMRFSLGASIGVAVYPEDGRDADTLLRNADIAMYHMKSQGRGSFHFFRAGMDAELLERVTLENEIDGAIARGEIEPFLQPLIDLSSGKVLGFEILARWQHPERGLLMPDLFIPIAEDSGKLGALTSRLLSDATAVVAGWPGNFVLSVNLAAKQIVDPDLPAMLLSAVSASGFPPYRLQIELTESALVDNMSEARAVLDELRASGVRIALDDFGTGFSGLYHLRELKLDSLKIDRSFIIGMLEDKDRQAIVEAVLHLSRALGIETTAEGVETPELDKRLADLGCQIGQGFYYSRPVPLAEAEALLRSTREARISA